MGCDIHTYIELLPTRYNQEKKTREPCGPWLNLTPYTLNEYDREEGPRMDDSFLVPWRNYGLFALLSNVRNGYGFAGVDTGDEAEPLLLHEGLPDDMSKEIQSEMAEWGQDLHSHTWCTLAELHDAIEDRISSQKETAKRGIIPWDQFIEWRKARGEPSSWCGGISGPGVQTYDLETAEKILEYGGMPDCLNPHVQVEWLKRDGDVLQPFYDGPMHVMRHMSAEIHYLSRDEWDNVRVIFAYDN